MIKRIGLSNSINAIFGFCFFFFALNHDEKIKWKKLRLSIKSDDASIKKIVTITIWALARTNRKWTKALKPSSPHHIRITAMMSPIIRINLIEFDHQFISVLIIIGRVVNSPHTWHPAKSTAFKKRLLFYFTLAAIALLNRNVNWGIQKTWLLIKSVRRLPLHLKSNASIVWLFP